MPLDFRPPLRISPILANPATSKSVPASPLGSKSSAVREIAQAVFPLKWQIALNQPPFAMVFDGSTVEA